METHVQTRPYRQRFLTGYSIIRRELRETRAAELNLGMHSITGEAIPKEAVEKGAIQSRFLKFFGGGGGGLIYSDTSLPGKKEEFPGVVLKRCRGTPFPRSALFLIQDCDDQEVCTRVPKDYDQK